MGVCASQGEYDSSQCPAFLKGFHNACLSRINKLLTGKEFTDRLFTSKKLEPSGNWELDQEYAHLLQKRPYDHPGRDTQTSLSTPRHSIG
jgi:hypothetical protein